MNIPADAKERIKAIAFQLAIEGAKCPFHARIVELTNEIAIQANLIPDKKKIGDPPKIDPP